MASDQYINSAYVEDRWGTALTAAIVAESGTDLTSWIIDATAAVKAAMKNSGYARVTTTDPADVDDYVKMAVFGQFWEMASARPGASLELPIDWETNPYKVALEAIHSGAAQLELEADTSAGVGGVQFTQSTDATSPQQMSRTNLEGY